MRQYLFIISTFFIIASCGNNKTTQSEREAESNIYSTPSDDQEMNEAIFKAQSTLEEFKEALQRNAFDTSTFALKVKFPTTTGAEHIWATSIQLENGDYYGIVDNLPNTTTQVKSDEKIKLNKVDITDWMYADNGLLCGGYTIRLIRSRMTESERKKFDATFKLKVENR